MAPLFLSLLLSAALKGVLVLALAWGIVRLTQRASAASQHGVWAVAFAALLLLPALEMAGPAWTVPLLPAPAEAPPAVQTTGPDATSEADAFVLQPGSPVPALPPQTEPATAEALPPALPDPTRSSSLTADPEAVAPDPLWRAVAPWAWGFAFWTMGALIVAAGWLAAFASAWRLVSRAREETDPDWLMLAERTRRRAGVPPHFRLLRSDRLDVPIAWGYGRGAVVLPPSADGWSAEQREAVLLHEMAHLRRRDAWTQVVAQAALALYWFNPLAWRAYRAFLSAREQACDDAALAGGTRPSSYAAHLVGVARAVRHEPIALSAVAPMARRTALEGRVLSVLDADRRRGPIGRGRLVATVFAGLGVLLPLAAFQPVAQAPAPSTTASATPQDAPLVIREAEGEVGEAQQQLQLALQQVEDVHRRVEAAHLRIGQAESPGALARARADLDAAQREWVAVQDTLSAAQEAIQEAVLARMGALPADEALHVLEASVRAAIADPQATPEPPPTPAPRASLRPPLPPATSAPPAPVGSASVDWDAIDRARLAALGRSQG